MITLFEEYKKFNPPDFYTDDTSLIAIENVMAYLGVDENIIDENTKPKSIYGVDIIDFFKEIFLHKYVTFRSVNRTENNPVIFGRVVNIELFAYQDELFVNFITNRGYIVSNYDAVKLQMGDYDAENKPLHKDVKMKKLGEKYNI
jgi:hypothetical protein